MYCWIDIPVFQTYSFFIQKNRASYENMQIIPSQLKDFARLGLIDCDFASEFVFVDKKEFQIGTKRIVVTGDPRKTIKLKPEMRSLQEMEKHYTLS